MALATGDFDEELASLSFDSFDIDGNGYVLFSHSAALDGGRGQKSDLKM